MRLTRPILLVVTFALAAFAHAACDQGSTSDLDGELGISIDCVETEEGDGTASVAIPFGSHPEPYAPGTILPDVASQTALDEATRDFYFTWKSTYVGCGCGDDRYFVSASVDDNNLTVSEAHGYGMIATALMAGADPDAQRLFDGMVRYYQDHPSAGSSEFLAWYQNTSCETEAGGSSATDGDLDIAYALLLADRQWGSCGSIDYRGLALELLKALSARVVDASRRWLLLGDWVSGDSYHGNATRSSDFMPGHLTTFAWADSSGGWEGLSSSLYDVMNSVQTGHARGTGLLPDFIQDPGSDPRPAEPEFLEGPHDGAYYWNACRVPWRLAMDALHNGDDRARALLGPLNAWIQSETAGQPGRIVVGYTLDGQNVNEFSSQAYVAPFGVAAMVAAENQSWLNRVWLAAESSGPQGYYADSIKLLSMLAMSSNWWAPETQPDPCN